VHLSITDDFFRARLDELIDPRHPLAVLSTKLAWPAIESVLAAKLAHQNRPTRWAVIDDRFGAQTVEVGCGVSLAGRRRLPIRLMAGLLWVFQASPPRRGHSVHDRLDVDRIVLLCHKRSFSLALPQQGHCPTRAISSSLRSWRSVVIECSTCRCARLLL
jgi:hypothetical protein